MDALAAGHDAAVQMIDISIARVHQHGACIAANNHQDVGRSRGGLTSKIHAVADATGDPVQIARYRHLESSWLFLFRLKVRKRLET